MTPLELETPPQTEERTVDITPQIESATLGGLTIQILRPGRVIQNSHYELQGYKTGSGRPLTAESILRTSGIQSRRIVTPFDTTQSLGFQVSQALIDEYRNEIQKVIFMTSHPDSIGRVTGKNHAESLVIQAQIEGVDLDKNTQTGAALDLHFACSNGAKFAEYARPHVRNLIVGSEIYSRKTADPTKGETDPSLSFAIFSDGAGAISYIDKEDLTVLASGQMYLPELGEYILMPIDTDEMMEPYAGIEIPSPKPDPQTGRKYFQMQGRKVTESAEYFANAAMETVRSSGIDGSEISLIIPHQASKPVLEKVMSFLPDELKSRFYIDVEEGNYSSVSILKAMAKLINNGVLKKDQIVVLMGFGAGLYSSTQVVKLGKAA